MDWEHTICAISTPPGEAAIGVVRISGPEAIRIAVWYAGGPLTAGTPYNLAGADIQFGRGLLERLYAARSDSDPGAPF